MEEEEEEYATSESEFVEMIKIENYNINAEEDTAWEEGQSFSYNENTKKNSDYKYAIREQNNL